MVQLERVKELQEFENKLTLGGVGTKLLRNNETGEVFVFESEITYLEGQPPFQAQDLKGKTLELNGETFSYMEGHRPETTFTIKSGQYTTRLNVLEIDNGVVISATEYFGVGSRPNDRKK